MSMLMRSYDYLTSLEFFQPKKEKLPFTKLPYAFKQRLIILAPRAIIKNFSRVYPTVEKYRDSNHPTVYSQLFITDDDEVLQWASKETYFFQLFKYLCQFEFFKHIFDGPYTINPVWQSVLSIDEAIAMKSDIYIEDTLVLHCNSIRSFGELSSCIKGPYSRLVINTDLWWNGAEHFIHKNVKQVRMNSKSFELQRGAYGRFIEFVKKHSRDFDSKFSFFHKNWRLKKGLADAFYPENNFTIQECRSAPDFLHVVHSKHNLQLTFCKVGPLIVTILFCFPLVAFLHHAYSCIEQGRKIGSPNVSNNIYAFSMIVLWIFMAIVQKLLKVFTVFYVPMDTMSGLERFDNSRKCRYLLESDDPTTHEDHITPAVCLWCWWLLFRVVSWYF